MVHFFRHTKINFIGQRKYGYTLSIAIIVCGIISIVLHHGLNWSIDFVGGTVIQLKFQKPVETERSKISDVVASLGYGTPEVKTIGKPEDGEIQIVVKKRAQTSEVGDEIEKAISAKFADNPFVEQKRDLVGPKIGGELRYNALLAVGLAFFMICVYIGIRFNLPFGMAAVVALIHDIMITVSIFSFVNAEFSLPVIAALLTIIGYSINDTIVVFDRVRENLHNLKGHKSFEDLFNESYNLTLGRTVNTSLATFLAIVTTFVFFFNTGDVLKLFSGAMCIGIITGTFSSLYVAGALVVEWNNKWPIDPKVVIGNKKR